jgi:hypothetical protein
VGSTVLISKPTVVAPNTRINLGVTGLNLVLNEQIPFASPDKGLTVNAIHMTFAGGGLNANVVIASSESDIRNCP